MRIADTDGLEFPDALPGLARLITQRTGLRCSNRMPEDWRVIETFVTIARQPGGGRDDIEETWVLEVHVWSPTTTNIGADPLTRDTLAVRRALEGERLLTLPGGILVDEITAHTTPTEHPSPSRGVRHGFLTVAVTIRPQTPNTERE